MPVPVDGFCLHTLLSLTHSVSLTNPLPSDMSTHSRALPGHPACVSLTAWLHDRVNAVFWTRCCSGLPLRLKRKTCTATRHCTGRYVSLTHDFTPLLLVSVFVLMLVCALLCSGLLCRLGSVKQRLSSFSLLLRCVVAAPPCFLWLRLRAEANCVGCVL